jgi:hypothetical protein
MENLTEAQKNIINSLENEFARINAIDNNCESDILKFIDNAVDDKKKLRLEMEALTKVNLERFVQEKDEIVAYLKPIAEKYGFDFYVEEGRSGDGLSSLEKFYLKIVCPNHLKKETNGSVFPIRIESRILIFYDYIDNVKCIKDLNIRYAKNYDSFFSSKEELLKYFVDEVIKALKTKV